LFDHPPKAFTKPHELKNRKNAPRHCRQAFRFDGGGGTVVSGKACCEAATAEESTFNFSVFFVNPSADVITSFLIAVRSMTAEVGGKDLFAKIK
jgi:hypothetical protein